MQMLAEAAKQEHLEGRIENWKESSWRRKRQFFKDKRKPAQRRVVRTRQEERTSVHRQVVKSGANKGPTVHPVAM